MIAWLSLAGAIAVIAAAVARMGARSSPPPRHRPTDFGDWPPDQMAP